MEERKPIIASLKEESQILGYIVDSRFTLRRSQSNKVPGSWREIQRQEGVPPYLAAKVE